MKPATVWLGETGLDPRDAFRLDCKPDSSNMHYDSLYSGDVATYRRNTQCVGLGPHQAVEWTDNRSRTVREKKTKPMRYFKVETAGEVVLHFSRKQAGANRDSSMDEYIALKPTFCGAEEFTPPTDLTLEMYFTQRTARYNRLLLEDPHNVSLWLEFIAFQDEALLWDKTSSVRRKSQTNERKLAIFERALESHPLSVDLLVGHMQLVEGVWDVERVVRRWKDLVFRQPNQPQLWLHYLHFCQSHFSSFTVSSLTALYTKCLSTLTAIQEGTLKSHKPDASTPQYMLAIFILYCNFLRQVGHSERAVACFQALVEFNLCRPAELDTEDLPSKASLEFLETFWDSGVPHFGEPDAPGWCNWMKTTQRSGRKLGEVATSLCGKSTEEVDADEVDPEVALVSGLSLSEAWLQLECLRTKEEGLPWRPHQEGSEEDCIDPERMVLLDDISQCVFRLSDPSLQFQLVMAFLHFLGAPSPTPHPLTFTPHHLSSCLENWSEVLLPVTDALGCLLSTDMGANQYPYYLLGIGCGDEDVRHLANNSKLQPFPTGYFAMVAKRTPAACNFISNVCNQALSLFSSASAQTTIAQVWVQFELSQLMKDLSSSWKPGKELRGRMRTVQRLVKALLRQEVHRNSLPLWNCCAQLEHLLGNSTEATNIFEAVLSEHPNNEKLTPLYRSFCGCLLGLLPPLTTSSQPPPNNTLALHATMCLAEGKYKVMNDTQIPPARILKARCSYEQTPLVNIPVDWVVCHSYFEYLTRGIKSACNVFDEWTPTLTTRLESLPSHSQEVNTLLYNLETAYHDHCCLILHHSHSHPIQPSILRSTIEKALSIFPNHSWFLAAYIECERQSFISGRLRRYFETQAHRARTAIPWLFAVYAELQRHPRLSELNTAREGGEGELVMGMVHRVRALFSRAVESMNGRHCPLLWRMAMAFEVRNLPLVYK